MFQAQRNDDCSIITFMSLKYAFLIASRRQIFPNDRNANTFEHSNVLKTFNASKSMNTCSGILSKQYQEARYF